MDDLIHQLLRVGFSENESRVYLAALELGRANATAIAQKAGLGRTTVHHVLQVLVKRSLVSLMENADERVFIAESPERIRSLLSFQLQDLMEKRELADQLMLRLKVFHNTEGQKPKIRYIESIDGLRMMQIDYEKRGGDIIQMLNYDNYLAIHDPSIVKAHKSALQSQKRRVRSILITKEQNISVPGQEILCIDPAVATMAGEMTVCGDCLVLFSYQNGLTAVEIISKVMADSARAVLELAWKEAQRLVGNTKAPM